MTITHAYMAGTPENPGHVYFDQDGPHLRCELEPEDVVAALDASMETEEEENPPSGRIWREEGMWVAEFEIDGRGPIGAQAETIKELFWRMAALATAEDKEKPLPAADHTPEAGWSDWLDWAGGECPLPPRAECQFQFAGDGRHVRGIFRAENIRWNLTTRFRYLGEPGGWVARPKGWVPPESLWAEGSPVRCILRTDNTECDLKAPPAHWDGFTHIRLLPRAPASEPAPEMPEGFTMDARGNLFMATAKDGKILVLALGNVDFAGNATILAAVTAWCDAMKARP